MLAIDPSSPFTGGAILGDRVRMQDHATDPGVFIRSMATRGHLGGLSLATPEAVRLLDAIGRRLDPRRDGRRRPGRGRGRRQGRHDRRRRQPRLGRQRAGQQGRADGDRRRVRRSTRPTARASRRPAATSSRCSSCPISPHDAWRPPIVPTVATTGDGVAELWDAVARPPRATPSESGSSTDAARRSGCARSCARSSPTGSDARAREICTGDRWDAAHRRGRRRTTDPWTAADEMLAAVDA